MAKHTTKPGNLDLHEILTIFAHFRLHPKDSLSDALPWLKEWRPHASDYEIACIYAEVMHGRVLDAAGHMRPVGDAA
jgi:hypothetical protein